MEGAVRVDLAGADLHSLIDFVAESDPADACASRIRGGHGYAAGGIAIVHLHGCGEGVAAIVGERELDFGLVVGGGEPGYGHVVFVGGDGWAVDGAGVDLPVVGEDVLGG